MKNYNRFILLIIILIYTQFGFTQSLEIHQLNVGHGDAAIIIVRDTAYLRNRLEKANLDIPSDRTEMLKRGIDNNICLDGTIKRAILIDGATQAQVHKINNYKKKIGVESFDYLCISHYHDDHIGGIPELLAQESGEVQIYDQGSLYEPSTKAYKKYVNSTSRIPFVRNTTKPA